MILNGRKVHSNFQGEVVSDYRNRPEGWRIKHRMKSNSIKMYDKHSVLRIEMTINDPKEFKVYKKVNHNDGTTSMRWSPMGKSISNIYRYAEVSNAANFKYLESLKDIIPKKSVEAEINAVCRKKSVKGKNFSGFNVWEEKTFELFTELSNGSYLIRGFTNQDIRRSLYPKKQADLKINRNRITRLFAKLRAHGLIKKVPHSFRYYLTGKGRRVFSALIETKNRTYPELAS